MKNFKFTLTLALACVAIALAVCAQAQTLSYVANFDYKNGQASTQASVIQATDGNFYGAAGGGGLHRQGVIFKATLSGELSAIYSFCSQLNCADGTFPVTSPVLGSDGNLYGVTEAGGSAAVNSGGSGTVYRMTLDGKITTLHKFCTAAPCSDGVTPAGLVLAGDGNFYGVAEGGGAFNRGTIFSISPSGSFKVLHSFCAQANCVDGAGGLYPPIQGIDGNFYGTAGGGSNGSGIIYKLTPDGAYTVLHSFCALANCGDGAGPNVIVQDVEGNFFGATQQDLAHGNYGTVFELTSTNQFIVLKSFNVEFGGVVAGLTMANDGNLYGTTLGPNSGGNIYEITQAGKLTFPHIFGQGCHFGGYDPWGALFQGTNGNLYGITLYGNGTGECSNGSGWGTIYSLSNGLSPLVETVPVAGKAGKSVLILGNGLTGTTSVTFNGVPAAFTVKSDTYIQATVPAGATTGKVSVVTPSGTLNSNPAFSVTN